MLNLLWLVPAIPFVSAFILAVFGTKLGKRLTAVVGTGSIGVSAGISIAVAFTFLTAPPADDVYRQVLWTWIGAGDFSLVIGLYLDALSLIMILVVTFVGFLIHLYSTEYMEESEGYSRFFSYMNLFVASMLTLVLGDNLLLLFLGWEGVGLCSYLLIGFWFTDPVNGRAAQKAFIVTRVGDTAFMIALFLLFTRLGTLDIQELLTKASASWPVGSSLAIAASALLLGGAVGKSAQLPLQTWLPDAMAGPTPTSALIHAATMVTAGVYLIARTHTLFELAPSVMLVVAIIGAVTLLMAGCSALTQREIKKVLAYSTISQIGYMFLALGVGAWSAAMFHFMTHAFFKALLFLAAGVVIEALHHENDIFAMGGLRRKLPVAFWSFIIGGSALAGLPYITAGYYSKDLIIWNALSAEQGSTALWIAGLAGAFLTALYTFRLIFVVFFGDEDRHITKRPRFAMTFPLVVLCFFSIFAGFLNIPPTLGGFRPFENFMRTALPEVREAHPFATELASEMSAAAMFVLGLALAWMLYLRNRRATESITASAPGRAVHRLWETDWGMDWLYDVLFVRPLVWLAAANKGDVVDSVYDGAARATSLAWFGLSMTETGRVRWYAAGIVAGTVVLLGVALFL